MNLVADALETKTLNPIRITSFKRFMILIIKLVFHRKSYIILARPLKNSKI